MKKILLSLALIATFVAGGITVNSYLGTVEAQEVDVASSHDESEEGHWGMMGRHGSEENHEAMMGEDVDHQVTNIDNGVVIEVTSSDPETVALIQEHHLNKEGDEGFGHWGDKLDVTRSVENIDNGVRMTLTSDDPDTVELLQTRSASGKGMFGGWGRHGEGHTEHDGTHGLGSE